MKLTEIAKNFELISKEIEVGDETYVLRELSTSAVLRMVMSGTHQNNAETAYHFIWQKDEDGKFIRPCTFEEWMEMCNNTNSDFTEFQELIAAAVSFSGEVSKTRKKSQKKSKKD